MESYPEGEEPPPNVISSYILLYATPNAIFSVDNLLLFILVGILIVGSALMSGSEVAFFSLDRQDTDDLEKERTPSAIRISRLLDNPHNLLATILIVNNLFNIAIILTLHLITHKLLAGFSPVLHFAIEVGLITFVLVLFGEIIPKVYANHFNLKMARLMSVPISFFKVLFFPLVKILVGSTSLIENRFSEKISKISADDIDQAIDLLDQKHGNEKEFLKRVIDFSNIMASEVMTNRTQVCYVKKTDSFNHLQNVILETGFSRIPVCVEDLDDVLGFIYAKDLLQYEDKAPNQWQELMRKPFFVSENTKIDRLLNQFKDNRQHIAIVADEYGGGSGVVTLEDVLEEVVGDIDDKFDIKNEEEKAKKNKYIVDGTISLLDLSKNLDNNLADFDELRGESDTLAGMLMEVKGDFLNVSEIIAIGDYKFKVLSKTDNQINQVKITPLNIQASKNIKNTSTNPKLKRA